MTTDHEALQRGQREKNRVPVLERTLDILDIIERRVDGATIRELSSGLNMPRSTVYRILNTLEEREMVRRTLSGSYMLGSRLLSLAANVVSGHDVKLVDIANARLEGLSRATGEASKMSVRDGDGVLVIAVAHGSAEYGLSIKPGRKLPLHAGAASKVLLAHAPEEDIMRILQAPLQRYTDQTVENPAALKRELNRIREVGWAFDNGEYSSGVQAVAAPVMDSAGRIVAAISIPFLSGGETAKTERLLAAVREAARSMSEDLQSRRG
jgi:IclR family acetate operon transcriptional repressor